MRIPGFHVALLGIGMAFAASSAAAGDDRLPLGEYLDSMNWAPVSFSGRISADDMQRENVFSFTKNGSRDVFLTVIDAGREMRERTEANCETDYGFSRNRAPCLIEGEGTVEIRGSQIYLSIESVTTLEIPED